MLRSSGYPRPVAIAAYRHGLCKYKVSLLVGRMRPSVVAVGVESVEDWWGFKVGDADGDAGDERNEGREERVIADRVEKQTAVRVGWQRSFICSVGANLAKSGVPTVGQSALGDGHVAL